MLKAMKFRLSPEGAHVLLEMKSCAFVDTFLECQDWQRTACQLSHGPLERWETKTRFQSLLRLSSLPKLGVPFWITRIIVFWGYIGIMENTIGNHYNALYSRGSNRICQIRAPDP